MLIDGDEDVLGRAKSAAGAKSKPTVTVVSQLLVCLYWAETF